MYGGEHTAACIASHIWIAVTAAAFTSAEYINIEYIFWKSK